MSVRAKWGALGGAFIALVVPISGWVLAQLVQVGIAPYDETHSFLGVFGLLSVVSLVLLGPVGIVIAAKSFGVRRVPALIALLIVFMPMVAFVSFVCLATLSGTLGNPF